MHCKWTISCSTSRPVPERFCRFATSSYAYGYKCRYSYLLSTLPHTPLRHPATLLQLSCPKALLLAGTDRLDRALTIGQMQVGAAGMGRADKVMQGWADGHATQWWQT